MKKLLFIAIICIYGISFGQEQDENLIIQKGTWNIGGNFSVQIANTEREYQFSTNENDYYNFNFFPSFGYAIKDNLVIGMGLGYGHGKSKNSSTNIDSTSDIYSIYPYVKKYIPLGDKLAIYLQGELRYSKNKNQLKSNNPDYSSLNSSNSGNTFFVGFRPGITYFLNKQIALEANIGSLGYTMHKSENNDLTESKSNSFNFYLNSSNLFFGLSYYF